MAITILHTSDIHLGSKFGFLAGKAGEQRDLLRRTFAKIPEVAQAQKADLLVIAGDLFDSPYPSSADVTQVQVVFSQLLGAGVKVALIPGNHDRLEMGSIFASDAFAKLEEQGLHIFREHKPTLKTFPELGINVYGTATKDRVTKVSPLAELSVDKSLPAIGVFHGSVDLVAKPENSPIYKQNIEDSGLAYVALGDWHSSLDVGTVKTKAWYCGSPEVLQADQAGAGSILKVELGETVSVEPIKIGHRSVHTEKYSVNTELNTAELITHIKTKVNKQDYLDLTLEGNVGLDNAPDIDAIKTLLADICFYAKISDKTEFHLSDSELASFPADTIIGRYIRLVQEYKQTSSDPDLADDALRLGVSMLRPITDDH